MSPKTAFLGRSAGAVGLSGSAVGNNPKNGRWRAARGGRKRPVPALVPPHREDSELQTLLRPLSTPRNAAGEKCGLVVRGTRHCTLCAVGRKRRATLWATDIFCSNGGSDLAAWREYGGDRLRPSALWFVGGDHPDRHPPHSAPSNRRSPPRFFLRATGLSPRAADGWLQSAGKTVRLDRHSGHWYTARLPCCSNAPIIGFPLRAIDPQSGVGSN